MKQPAETPSFIELPGGRFHYLSWGAEDRGKRAAVLLHGITSCALSWSRVGRALAATHRVYAMDLRGHGQSVKSPPGTYGLRRAADDAVEFIEALRLQRPVLAGHSWGGAVAIVAASGESSPNPAPVLDRVILEDPAHNFAQTDIESLVMKFTRDIGRPEAELRQQITAANPAWTEEDVEGKVKALQQASRTAVASVVRESGEFGDLLPLLSKIAAPVLVLRAERQRGSVLGDNAWLRAQDSLSSGSRAVEIAGAGHSIHRSAFAAFMQELTNFLVQP